MPSGFKERFSTLNEALAKVADDSDFEERAKVAGVDSESLKNIARTLVGIEKNKNIVPTDIKFTRVRIGKLTVPVGFVRHIELLAKFADVSEEAVWQLLMIETCAMYADRYSALMENLNNSVKEN